jgi:hypothetical protein
MSYGISSHPFVKPAAMVAAVLLFAAACDASAFQPSPAMRYQADTARHRVWALTAEGASVHEAASPEGVDIALPGWQWVGAPYACPPALALAADGAALVTSNIIPVVWRIDPVTLAVTVHRLALDADTNKDVGFSAIVYSPRHAAYFAISDVHGSLWRIDARLESARKIRLTTALPKACSLVGDDPPHGKSATAPVPLCLRGVRRSWTIQIARDLHTVDVRAARCGSKAQ